MHLKQLLRNYLYMLNKEIERTPGDAAGRIEFLREEISRVEVELTT